MGGVALAAANVGMSLIRTGHQPADWRDEGPNAPGPVRRPYSSVPASTVGSMSPVLTGAAVVTAAEAERAARRREANREAAQRYRESLR